MRRYLRNKIWERTKYRSTICLLFGLVTIAILQSMSGCVEKKGSSSGKTIINDMLGRRVEIPQPIKRVVGVRAGALRLLVYMDATAMVSGIEDVELRPGRAYTFAHPELLTLPLIGPMMGGDAELIAVNQPDVIFMTFATIGEADDLQNKTGIPVIALNSGNLSHDKQNFFQSLQLIGEVINRPERADSLTQFIQQQEQLLKSLTPETASQAPKVYLGGVSYSGAHGITSTNPFYEGFEMVNAHNVAKNVGGFETRTGASIDIEQLLVWNPDHIFIDAAGLALVNPQLSPDAPGISALTALNNRRVHTLMPYNWYSTNYETILVNAWFIASVLYPEKVSESTFLKQKEEIYRFFLGKDVSTELKTQYMGWITGYQPGTTQ